MEKHIRARLNNLSLTDLNIVYNFLNELLVGSEKLSDEYFKYQSMIKDVKEVMKLKINYIFDI